MATTTQPLTSAADFDVLLARIADAHIVMIGEASHGTHDFYGWRERLTRRLVDEFGFGFVAVEGDWPDCDRVHRAVTTGDDPVEALYEFDRWPTWMWANSEVAEFCRWLRGVNALRPAHRRVGFHGLDVYSLTDSLQILAQHARAHGDDLNTLWEAVRCFEPFGHDPQGYAWAGRMLGETCEPEVLELLTQARDRAAQESPRPGADDDRWFSVWQNAEVVAGAERYYRTMMRGGSESWNVRDTHMADTLDRLLDYYGAESKGVVWAHNTHIGDARATDMADDGTVNIGQLARERHGDNQVVLIGFGTYSGQVVAAHRWAGPQQVMAVPPAREDSVEAQLHMTMPPSAVTVFGSESAPVWQSQRLGHRAIGVVYDPQTEHLGNYVPTVLRDRYDALIWCETTSELHPIHARPAPGELETYPTGA
jgi:erythromycin esterase-like protein